MVFVAGTITTSLPWKEWSALAPPIGCLPAGRDGYTNALLWVPNTNLCPVDMIFPLTNPLKTKTSYSQWAACCHMGASSPRPHHLKMSRHITWIRIWIHGDLSLGPKNSSLGNTQPHADNPLAFITKWNRWILHAFWRWRKPWKTDEKTIKSGSLDWLISAYQAILSATQNWIVSQTPSYENIRWCPPVTFCWFISPINYR